MSLKVRVRHGTVLMEVWDWAILGHLLLLTEFAKDLWTVLVLYAREEGSNVEPHVKIPLDTG